MATPIKIGPLITIEEISREYRRVYRQARRGRLDMSDASKLCFMLKQLSGMRKDHELENRIEAIEKDLGI